MAPILDHFVASIRSLRRYMFQGGGVSHVAVLVGCVVGISLSGCFKATDGGTKGGAYDFVSSPVKYRVIESHRMEAEMLASKKTYEFQTCLKDRITMRSLTLSSFMVDGELYVSDDEGCLTWQKTESFNPYVQSYPMNNRFDIVGEGKYPGRLLIPYVLNPWAGLRPTTTAEFVEIFDSSLEDTKELEGAKGKKDLQQPSTGSDIAASNENEGEGEIEKKSYLKILGVQKRVFSHNTAARDHETHWHLDVVPQLEVYDSSGVAHSVIPQNGKVDVVVELMGLSKNHSLTVQNLAYAKLHKKHTFENLSIEAGKLRVIEKLSSALVSERENLLLKISLVSNSDLAKEGMLFTKTLYFVNQDLEVETLQEADISELPAVERASAEDASQEGGYAHPTFYAENPAIQFLRVRSRTTTTVHYDLQFSTKLIHRASGKPIKNTDLYMTLQGAEESRQVRVNSDGMIYFEFDFLYKIYSMQHSLQDLRFFISNKEKTLSVEVPLFFRPWDDGQIMSMNPDRLAPKTLAHYRNLKLKRPTVFIQSYSIEPPKDFQYSARKDLSLRIHYDYQFKAEVKMRSHAYDKFERTRVVNAPDGVYRLDVYLSCAKKNDRHLINRSLYHLIVEDDLQNVVVERIVDEDGKDAYKYRFCPANKTTQDVYVEDGQISEMLPLVLPDPRMSWVTSQMTFVLTPYETQELADPIRFTSKLKLSEDVMTAPITNLVNIKLFNKSERTMESLDNRSRAESSEGEQRNIQPSVNTSSNVQFYGQDNLTQLDLSVYEKLHSWEEVQLLEKKWKILEKYFAHFNSLDSEYLDRFNFQYVSLENIPYTALNFPENGKKTSFKRRCSVKNGECLRDVSVKRSMSFSGFNQNVLSKIDMSLTRDELRDIVWNREGNRLEELLNQLCGFWVKGRPDQQSLSRSQNTKLLGKYFKPYEQKCQQLRSGRWDESLYQWRSKSLVAHHLLKGEVQRAEAKDAGTDILGYKEVRSKGISRGLAMYTTLAASFNLIELFESLTQSFMSLGVGLKTSVSKSGEYEESDQEELGGGPTHYSNWTTLQMYLKFDKPKYCLLLRFNHENFLNSPHMRHLRTTMDKKHSREWFLKLLRDMGEGYLICTREQPPELVEAKERGDEEASTVALEYYRFPEPRFNNPSVYDPNSESFRSWLYPLRGQSDYLKFIYGLGDLNDPMNQNKVQTVPGLNLTEKFQNMSDEYVAWFIEDKAVMDVRENLFGTSQEFVKFPKGFIYKRFSQVTPSIGGYYSY